MEASDDQKWYEDRDEAFALAQEEGKFVFLLYGKTECPHCNAAKEHISKAPIDKIIKDNFVLWFCDYDIPEKRAQGVGYQEYYVGSISLPLLCVIDPKNPMPALSYSTGGKTAIQIENILNANLPTANENITTIFNKAYIADNELVVLSENMNEVISVYTFSGQMIDSFVKRDNIITRNIHSYPKGILLVCSSQRWTVKVVNQ